MSKATVALVFAALSLLVGCKSDDDDADPNTPAGSGGLGAIGSGGAAASNGGMSGMNGASGSGGMTVASGSGGMTVASGSGGASGSTAGTGAAGMSGGPPTFARVWSEILVVKSCNSAFCHGMAQGMLSMKNKDDAYMNLVGVMAAGPACGMSGMLRVKPSAPTESLLLDKISNATPACGDPMPIGTKFPPNCLSNTPQVCNTEQETTLVRDWIAAGAMND